MTISNVHLCDPQKVQHTHFEQYEVEKVMTVYFYTYNFVPIKCFVTYFKQVSF